MENIHHTNSKQKQAGVALLILDKTDSKTNYINKDKKDTS